MIYTLELTEDYSEIVTPHLLLDPEKRRYFLYFIEDFPIRTALALEFLIREKWGKDVSHVKMLHTRCVIDDYFEEYNLYGRGGNTADDVLDLIRQIITLGYDVRKEGFYQKLSNGYRRKIGWYSDDQNFLEFCDFRAKILFRIVFESCVKIRDPWTYETRKRDCMGKYPEHQYYLDYVKEITLFELIYVKLYHTRFSDIEF